MFKRVSIQLYFFSPCCEPSPPPGGLLSHRVDPRCVCLAPADQTGAWPPVGQARLKEGRGAFSQFGVSCISLGMETNFKFT